MKCPNTDVSVAAVEIMKLSEKGELMSPKLAPDTTAPTDANNTPSIISGSGMLALINRIARGMTVVTVKMKEPHRKLMRQEKRKKIRGKKDMRGALLSITPRRDEERSSFRASDTIDIARII